MAFRREKGATAGFALRTVTAAAIVPAVLLVRVRELHGTGVLGGPAGNRRPDTEALHALGLAL